MADTYVRVSASQIEERRRVSVEEFHASMQAIADERADLIQKVADLERQVTDIKMRANAVNGRFDSMLAASRENGYPDPSWLPRYNDQYPDPSWMGV